MVDNVKKFLVSLRPFVKPFLIIFAVYCFAMLAVWRSGVSFVDDKGRAIFGYAWTSDFNRFSSTAFGLLLNMNDRLLDISPWPQILAMGMLAAVSVILVYVFCEKQIKYLPLVLTAFVGLLPLTLECWLYKFDAPCIALAVLASVIPILWWPKDLSRKALMKFGLVTVFCLLVMWTTYQAASGVLPVLCLYMCLWDYLANRKIGPSLKKLGFAVVMCAIPALVFKFCLPEPVKSYRVNEMLAFSDLVVGIVRNFCAHIDLMVRSLNIWQKILAVLSVAGASVLVVWRYRGRSWAVMAVALVALPLSMGAYLLLEEPPLTARSMVGIGVAFVPLLVMITRGISGRTKDVAGAMRAGNTGEAERTKGRVWQYICVVPSLALLYSFMMFALALGNGLADQERWANYRVENLVSELAEIYPSEEETMARKIQINGDIGYSAVMEHVVEKYPAARELVTMQQTGLSKVAWGLTKIRSYHKRFQVFEEDHAYEVYCGEGMGEVVAETYYYMIRETESHVCVDLR